jgi:hypothetical protein
MMKVRDYYKDVLGGDFTRIKERSPNFHTFVLQCARQDERRDVVDALMKHDFSGTCNPTLDWVAISTAVAVLCIVVAGVKRITYDSWN